MGRAGGRGRRHGSGREGRMEWEGQKRGAGGMEAVGGAGGKGQSVKCQLPVSPHICSGDGSATSGASEEVKSPAAMAQAVKVHQDTSRVMYFA